MHPVALIERLAATSQRREKERILREACHAGSDDFFVGARLAYDPLVTFGITKVAEIIEDDGAPGDYSFAEFFELANRLHRRQVADPREAIHAAAARCDATTWNRFYRCILLKDLRVGIDAALLNKAVRGYPQFSVPVFKCQLSRDGDPSQLRGRKLVDTVLAGKRTLAMLDPETGLATLLDCNGKSVPAMQTSLQRLLARFPRAVVLDGMLGLPDAPQRLNAVLRAQDAELDALRFTLFDILPLADFRLGRCVKSQRERHAMLEVLQEAGLWNETNGMITVLPQIEVDFDSAADRQAFREFAQQALIAGHHSLMVKDPMAPYASTRNDGWQKFKLSDLIDGRTCDISAHADVVRQ